MRRIMDGRSDQFMADLRSRRLEQELLQEKGSIYYDPFSGSEAFRDDYLTAALAGSSDLAPYVPARDLFDYNPMPVAAEKYGLGGNLGAVFGFQQKFRFHKHFGL